MKLLVTGGCGFIGSNFVRRMLERTSSRPAYTIVNFDLLTYAGNLQNLDGLPPDAARRHRFVRGDIADPAAVGQVMGEGIEAVVNFAAESHVDRSIEEAGAFVRTNVQGTQTLLDAARRAGVKRFVQVSTDEVYGALELDSPDRFTETTPLAPRSPYAASKAAADLLARAAFVTHELPVVITRCSNNYGPYQFPEKFLPQMILNALQGTPLPLYGDGLYVRDWLHVEDHCAAIEAALERGVPGQVYNIGGDAEYPNLEVAKAVLRLTGRPESLLKSVADRRAHDRRYAIDASRARRDLGWRPRWTFDRGLEAAVEWYRGHEAWWRRIVSGEYLVDRKQAVSHAPAGSRPSVKS